MKHRRNRRIVGDAVHDAIWANPQGYTRESRRAAGHRGAITEPQPTRLYRYGRRHMDILPRMGVNIVVTRRVRKARARIERKFRAMFGTGIGGVR